MADTTVRSPTEADRELIRTIIDRHEAGRPEGVRRIDFAFDEDWAGKPAVYIDLIVDKKIEPTNQKARELNEFIRLIQDEVIESKIEFWPYSRTFTED